MNSNVPSTPNQCEILQNLLLKGAVKHEGKLWIPSAGKGLDIPEEGRIEQLKPADCWLNSIYLMEGFPMEENSMLSYNQR